MSLIVSTRRKWSQNEAKFLRISGLLSNYNNQPLGRWTIVKYILSFLIICVFAFQNSAWAAKKRHPVKAKDKISAQKSKKGKSAKIKSAKSKKLAKLKSKKWQRKPASSSPRKRQRNSTSIDQPTKMATREPSGMAGLGLAAGGGMTANKAFEVRGQARTLSMMLILRNGKENVNFVKVRQNYATEIAKTEF